MSHGEVFPKVLLILFSQDFDLLNKLAAKKSSHKNVKWCAAAFTFHTTYSSNNKWQKYAAMGLNGFILEKINED